MSSDHPDFDPNPSRADLLDDIKARGRRYRRRRRWLAGGAPVATAVLVLAVALLNSGGHPRSQRVRQADQGTTTTIPVVEPPATVGPSVPGAAPGVAHPTQDVGAPLPSLPPLPLLNATTTLPPPARLTGTIWFAVLHSPDGDITHVNQAGIWHVNIDGSNPREVLSDPTAVDRGPAVSPDGRLVAFVSDRNTPNRSSADFYQLYLMNSDGSGVRQLTFFTPTQAATSTLGEGALTRPSWSPDGKRIAFNAQAVNNTESRLWVINVDGSGLKDITAGANRFGYGPDWSPDGTKILFEGQNGLWTVSPDGSSRRQLANTPASTSTTRWSPDGRQIIESLGAGSCGSQLWALDANGGHLHQFLSDHSDDYTPYFGRNGKYVAFASDPDGLKTGSCGGPKPAAMQVMDIDGRNRHTVYTPPALSNVDDTYTA